ncbi:ABC transporter permease [Murdochiella massiliensis]|uniref:ABC transporter permease n=1 Tax=Murdochiella massiliensis TaxID=1673723 RepID=UPI0008336C70|nr:ABC transporter permease [Murdochiella massiliensis]MBY0584291.1 ABC transporter permease [Murdochiella sp. Marseille-P8839]
MDIVIFIFQQMLNFAIPLLVVALAAMFSERSGVINIGLEGIMVIGAFAGTLYLHVVNDAGQEVTMAHLWVAIALSILAGTVYSAFHAFASINMFADQTISGTAINMFAGAFAIFVARSLIGIQQISFTGHFTITEVPVLSKIPLIGPILFQNVYVTTYLVLILWLVSTIVLYKTSFGLRLRSAGEYPQATDAAGVSVARIRWAGVLISGALGGLGGLAYILPVSTEFNGTVAGYGFLAIAVLIFGQWNPISIGLAAFFFGLLKALSSIYSGIPFLYNLGIPQFVYQILPYVITILLLAFTSKKTRAPAAEGRPFDKGQR